MLGFQSKDEAIETYDKAFNGDLGPKLRDEVFSVTIDGLKAWIEKGDTKKPFKPIEESRAAAIARALLDGLDSGQEEILDLLTQPEPPRDIHGPFDVIMREGDGANTSYWYLTSRGSWGAAPDMSHPFTYAEAIKKVNWARAKWPKMDVDWAERWMPDPERQKWDAEHPPTPPPKAWTAPPGDMSAGALPFGSYTTEAGDFDARSYLLAGPRYVVRYHFPPDPPVYWGRNDRWAKVQHATLLTTDEARSLIAHLEQQGYPTDSLTEIPASRFGLGEAEEPFDAREYFTHERYRPKAVNIGGDMWNDDRRLRNVFSWLTRIGAAPKFGTVPIHYYQQDQMKALDAIIAAAQRKGFEPEWVRYKNGKFIAHNKGKWVPIARMDYGTITPI